VDFIGWGSRYRCDATTATCVVLRRLATNFRWEDVELEFGMRTSALSEVFWEALEIAKDLRASLITDFRRDLMELKMDQYSRALSEVVPLNNCVGFIDCTKIQISRPGGPSANQRALSLDTSGTTASLIKLSRRPTALCFICMDQRRAVVMTLRCTERAILLAPALLKLDNRTCKDE
jgi:hypothetical protein